MASPPLTAASPGLPSVPPASQQPPGPSPSTAAGGPGGRTIQPAWKSVPVTYVACTNDQAIPPSSQRQMAQRAETLLEWPTDHSPFMTSPAAVAELIARYA